MEISYQQKLRLQGRINFPRIKRLSISFGQSIVDLFKNVKLFGYTNTLNDYELVKLGIFNQLNFFQILTGLFVTLTCISIKQFPPWGGIVASLPMLVSLVVLYLNKRFMHQVALVSYFIFHPLATSLGFMNGIHLGLDLYFVLYGILAVFFLADLAFMVFTICFSMVNFFLLSVVFKQFRYQLENFNDSLYLINEGIAIVFIFYGLYLIKNENTIYQIKILDKQMVLQQKSIQIQLQADKIKENAALLEKQTKELTDLNTLKNKMFGVISHDLKGPMHAIRNLFNDVEQKKISPKVLEQLMPEVVNDLNYTVDLMDNLLKWVKTQMQSQVVYLQKVDMGKLVDEVVQLVRLQADRKKITIGVNADEDVYGIMDKEMIHLVLRNLLSNAIKFTPEKGIITVGVNANRSLLEVYVKDSGMGMTHEGLNKVRNNNFYTTKGTANESGTGLGLMLCKEYLYRNESELFIESMPGKGSTFSFTLQRSIANKKVA